MMGGVEGARLGIRVGRRQLLKGAGLLVGTQGALSAAATAEAAAGPPDGRADPAGGVRAGAGEAVVETLAGRVAGYVRGGVYTFKGVPYADSPAGANRFLPPRPPKPWPGVRSSRHYGPVCPQDKGLGRLNDEEAFIFQWSDSVEREDCLRVNLWTPGINDAGGRPVMVWLHGGGFAAGSGHDLPAFDGENLARRGDVVVVTLNHRLNLLGYLDLSQYGERFAPSGNVGMLDIVAALEWVRDNIARFGGDPRRVLIFGQSGGGAKVATLMGMPAARGLFHRAIVMSGSFSRANSQDKARRLTDLFVSELGLGPGSIDRLQSTPYADLRRASEAVLARVNRPFGGFVDVRRIPENLNFAPVVDGAVLPASPFHPDAPAMSADVPMIVGTTLNEFVSGIGHPEVEAMSEPELAAKAEAFLPGRGASVIAAFRRRTPDDPPFDLWSRIATAPIRQSAVDLVTAKAAQGRAPTYLYWFTWRTPVLDARPRAFHCLDIPFAFHNSDRCDTMTGGGPRARELSDRVADAFIAFARGGDPNHPGLPRWTPYDGEARTSMIFDDRPRVERDPDGEERASIA